jgi:hypothetical protein
MTLAEGRAYLRAHYLPLTEIIDGLEERGLALARFRQLHRPGRITCLSLKLTGMPGDYFLVLALNNLTEVRLFRDTGKPPLLSVRLDELSVDGICQAMWNDTLRR